MAHSFSRFAGNIRGDVTLVVFFDFGCEPCKRMEATLRDLCKADPQLRIVYKELAFKTALLKTPGVLTNAAILQIAKSNNLNIKQLAKDMDNPEYNKQLQDNKDLADELDILDTPSFVIGKTPGNIPLEHPLQQFLLGNQNMQELQRAISQVRKS